MFQSRLSDIVRASDRAKTDYRFFSQFKISCQKIEILARVVDLFLFAIASTLGGFVYHQLAILSSRSLAMPVFLSALNAGDSSCLFRLLISSSAFL